ncbi:MAG: metalloregulator ArsR/SmtB family transcription factor [Gammaproteobacteria bacterium]|nr:MAG: metalloregulator ArsR/SmtB family transcription factor [Gammaproteobacteria bacterium]
MNDKAEYDDMIIQNDEDIDIASRALKAMAHPLRLKILCILGTALDDKHEISVQDLVERVGTSQSNISQHLSILRDKHILVSRKDANKVYYRIGEENILHLIEAMQDAFCSDPAR